MTNTIFFDIDNTLNTLCPYIMQFFGVPCDDNDYSLLVGKYDIVDVVNMLKGTGYSPEMFWNLIPQWVWAKAPVCKYFDWILNCSVAVCSDEIYLATSTTKSPNCLAGKLEWIHSVMPERLHRNYFITPRKWLLGRPGALLLDDYGRNCELFEQYGGKSVVYPQPWNTYAGRDVRESLIEQAPEIFR